MKTSAIILAAALCGITAFAAESVNFATKPALEKLTEKTTTSFRILPENLKQDRYYRITGQVKMTEPGMIASGIRRETEKSLWRASGSIGTEWQEFSLYVDPGEAWTCSLGARPKGNTFQFKDLKVEEMDQEDLTKNLLPTLKGMDWHTVWSKTEAKIGFEKCEDSPFGSEVLAAEISKGTGYPATMSIPLIHGRTLVVKVWVKGEPDANWWVSIKGCGSKKLPVTGEWRKQELRFQVKDEAPKSAVIVFVKKLKDDENKMKCSFGKVEAYYEEK